MMYKSLTLFALILLSSCGSGGKPETSSQAAGPSGEMEAPSVIYAAPSEPFQALSSINAIAPEVKGVLIKEYGIAPALPDGLVLDKATGVISGTPQAAALPGAYTISAIHDGGVISIPFRFTITVPTIANGGPTVGYVGAVDGQGGCYDLRNAVAAVQITFKGYNQYLQSIGGNLTASPDAIPTGAAYLHETSLGDSLTVHVNGNELVAVANLSYGLVAYVQTYGGGYLCGVHVNSGILTGENRLNQSSYLLGHNYAYLGVSI